MSYVESAFKSTVLVGIVSLTAKKAVHRWALA